MNCLSIIISSIFPLLTGTNSDKRLYFIDRSQQENVSEIMSEHNLIACVSPILLNREFSVKRATSLEPCVTH